MKIHLASSLFLSILHQWLASVMVLLIGVQHVVHEKTQQEVTTEREPSIGRT